MRKGMPLMFKGSWCLLLAVFLLVIGVKAGYSQSENAFTELKNIVFEPSGNVEPTERQEVREDKYVGIFYWTWHTDGIAEFDPVMNITEILEEYPEAAHDADHPAWQGIEGGVFWWDEPLFGYYRTTDEWILRKHAEMLAYAGVDVVFLDCTNGSFTWKSSYTKLLEVWDQARKDGVRTPQVVFLLPFGPTPGSLQSITELYADLYKPGLYEDLWFKWEGKPLSMAYPEGIQALRNSAGLKFHATAPFTGVNATCPSWGNNIGSLTFKLYQWKGSYDATVDETPLAEETFVDFQDNSKLELTFGQLPAGDYLWELSDGTERVGVWKYTSSGSNTLSYFGRDAVNGNYESEIFYAADGSYTALTSGSEHVPVEIGQSVSEETAEAIRNFFTFRPGQPDYVYGPQRDDHWGWLEVYPQHGFGEKPGGGFEEVTVGVAQNASDDSGGHAAAFNSPDTYGRSYTHANGQDPREDSYLFGLNFQEQWERAHALDPDLVFVTGWNEWTAGRHFDWNVEPFSFVDQYSAEKSRDIEPVKSWGDKGDIYYLQLIENIRRFKGASPPEIASPQKTIDMEDPEAWQDVKPQYNAFERNVLHRDHAGQGSSLEYTNTTGRNDLVKAKVARDDQFVWFYVETAGALTSKDDPGWMRLFIDIDRNKNTGWKGYDYVVNRINPADSAFIEKSNEGWNWTQTGKAAYVCNEKSLILKIARNELRIADTPYLNFEFKWSDNMQEEGNIMDFYVNGDAAPAGRFNYLYFTSEAVAAPDVKSSPFRMYPNPARNFVNIDFQDPSGGPLTVSIFNSSGQLLFQKNYEPSGSPKRIDTGSLPEGIYFVNVAGAKGSERKKLIVK